MSRALWSISKALRFGFFGGGGWCGEGCCVTKGLQLTVLFLVHERVFT